MNFEITFSGHKNIRSNHQKTIEITKETFLTPQGDCIIGVASSSSCLDLPELLKSRLQNPNSKIKFCIQVGSEEFVVYGRGHPDLVLTDNKDIVLRKSDFVCPRTISIKCDKASDMLPRSMVAALQNPDTRGKFVISVE